MPGVAFSDNPMTLTIFKWKAVLFCAVLALAVSCSGIPAADVFVAPRIVETSCMVDENTVELTCIYSTKLGFKQFGFSYGSKEGGMTDVISTDVQPHEFKVRLTDLQYDSTYTYYAFISNGSRRYSSFESEFKTEPCPEEKSMIDKYFADQDFLSEVMKVADANHDGHISVSEAKALTSLDISRDIYSIDGLEYFENLRSFTCCGHYVPSSLNLSSIKNLEYLSVPDCKLESIVLPEKIKHLNVRNNELYSLDVGRCPLLETLDCSENQYLVLLYLLVDNCIREINCDHTAINILDLTGFSSLQSLVFMNSTYSYLDKVILKGCSSLSDLKLNSGRMTEIDLHDATDLDVVEIYGGKYGNLMTFDLSMIKNVSKFVLMDCSVSELDFSSNCKKVKFVTVERTDVESLDFTGCHELSTIVLRDNELLKSVKLLSGHEYVLEIPETVELIYE